MPLNDVESDRLVSLSRLSASRLYHGRANYLVICTHDSFSRSSLLQVEEAKPTSNRVKPSHNREKKERTRSAKRIERALSTEDPTLGPAFHTQSPVQSYPRFPRLFRYPRLQTQEIKTFFVTVGAPNQPARAHLTTDNSQAGVPSNKLYFITICVALLSPKILTHPTLPGGNGCRIASSPCSTAQSSGHRTSLLSSAIDIYYCSL